MNSAAYHAVRSRHGAGTVADPADPADPAGRADPADPAAAPRTRAPTGSHTASASTAGNAHTASAGRHDPPSACRAGSVSAAASIAPPMSPAVYNPVTGPTHRGNRARTSAGSSAPATAIPMPASTVEAHSGTAPPATRSAVPPRISATAAASTRPRPNR